MPELKFAVKAAAAAVESGSAQLKQAQRLRCTASSRCCRRASPRPSRWTRRATAGGGRDQRACGGRAAAQSGEGGAQRLDTLTAQRLGAVAAVHLAQLDLSYCEVRAPFPGRVISLNISAGAYASAGIPVFSLLDTRHWYVMANFREGEIRHMAPGTEAEVYLLSAPERRFRGKVQGIGWAVEPEDEVDFPHALPYVKRELNWVHIAQRFPVRIEVEDPDPDLFRMGASAVAIIKGESK